MQQNMEHLNQYEQYLDSNGIKHKLIRPRTPQLNGKVDEFLRIGTIRLDLILL